LRPNDAQHDNTARPCSRTPPCYFPVNVYVNTPLRYFLSPTSLYALRTLLCLSLGELLIPHVSCYALKVSIAFLCLSVCCFLRQIHVVICMTLRRCMWLIRIK
ncbi:hypothetical protein Salat_2538500, partial [Sesamum alatum]